MKQLPSFPAKPYCNLLFRQSTTVRLLKYITLQGHKYEPPTEKISQSSSSPSTSMSLSQKQLSSIIYPTYCHTSTRVRTETSPSPSMHSLSRALSRRSHPHGAHPVVVLPGDPISHHPHLPAWPNQPPPRADHKTHRLQLPIAKHFAPSLQSFATSALRNNRGRKASPGCYCTKGSSIRQRGSERRGKYQPYPLSVFVMVGWRAKQPVLLQMSRTLGYQGYQGYPVQYCTCNCIASSTSNVRSLSEPPPPPIHPPPR